MALRWLGEGPAAKRGGELLRLSGLDLVRGPLPPITGQAQRQMDDIWDAATAMNPGLFDGPTLVCTGRRMAGDRLVVHYAHTNYRYYALRRTAHPACGSLYVATVQPTPQGPPGPGQGVSAGDDRRARGRHQGADRAGRRVPRVVRVVGRPAALVQAAWDGRSGARGRRRCAGFWKALREVFPQTKEPRCWFHVLGNVLAALPKSAHPGAKAALAQIYNAEDREHAAAAAEAFAGLYGAKWPKAVAKITEHLEVLLAFYDYPAEHWIHLRTTNPIESTFATVRLRQRVTKGPGSRAAGIAMAFKLMQPAQHRWRAVNAPHLVALVRAGARFDKGKLVERPDESGGDQQVA